MGVCGGAQRARLLACHTYLRTPELIQEDRRFEDESDGMRTKTDEDVGLGVSQEQIGNEEICFN